MQNAEQRQAPEESDIWEKHCSGGSTRDPAYKFQEKQRVFGGSGHLLSH